jgi:hypothetical protein
VLAAEGSTVQAGQLAVTGHERAIQWLCHGHRLSCYLTHKVEGFCGRPTVIRVQCERGGGKAPSGRQRKTQRRSAARWARWAHCCRLASVSLVARICPTANHVVVRLCGGASSSALPTGLGSITCSLNSLFIVRNNTTGTKHNCRDNNVLCFFCVTERRNVTCLPPPPRAKLGIVNASIYTLIYAL